MDGSLVVRVFVGVGEVVVDWDWLVCTVLLEVGVVSVLIDFVKSLARAFLAATFLLAALLGLRGSVGVLLVFFNFPLVLVSSAAFRFLFAVQKRAFQNKETMCLVRVQVQEMRFISCAITNMDHSLFKQGINSILPAAVFVEAVADTVFAGFRAFAAAVVVVVVVMGVGVGVVVKVVAVVVVVDAVAGGPIAALASATALETERLRYRQKRKRVIRRQYSDGFLDQVFQIETFHSTQALYTYYLEWGVQGLR